MTFLLPDDGTPHPFKGLKTGPAYGQRIALGVALISDDESETKLKRAKAEAKPDKPIPEKPSGPKSYAQRIAMLCGEPSFQRFLEETYAVRDYSFGTTAAEGAAQAVRERCGVDSRREIIEGTEAGRRWRDLEAEYQSWMAVPA